MSLKDPVARREYHRQWRIKNKERLRAYQLENLRLWRDQNPEKVEEHNRRWCEYRKRNVEKIDGQRKSYFRKHPEKLNARRAVLNAIRRGELIRQSCWCGAYGQAHHEDYLKPLDVVWLCSKHHGIVHRKTGHDRK